MSSLLYRWRNGCSERSFLLKSHDFPSGGSRIWTLVCIPLKPHASPPSWMVSDQRNITAVHKVMTFLRLSHKSCLENKSKNPSYLHDPPSPLIFLDVSIFGYKTSVYFLRPLLVLIKGTPPPYPHKRSPTSTDPPTGNRPKDYCEENTASLLTPKPWWGHQQEPATPSWTGSGKRAGEQMHTARSRLPEGPLNPPDPFLCSEKEGAKKKV